MPNLRESTEIQNFETSFVIKVFQFQSDCKATWIAFLSILGKGWHDEEKVMGMKIGSGGGAAMAQAAQSSVAQWQQASVATPAPAAAPAAPAVGAQLLASLTQGSNVNTYA